MARKGINLAALRFAGMVLLKVVWFVLLVIALTLVLAVTG